MSDHHSTRLVAYAPNGGRLGVLPVPLAWSASIPWEDQGAASLTYARVAAGGGILGRTLTQGLELALEEWNGTAWVEPDGARYVVLERSNDRLDDTDTVQLTAPAYGWLLSKVKERAPAEGFYAAEGDNAGRRQFIGQTAGSVAITLLNEYAQRGGPVIARDFTATHDSLGKPWPPLNVLWVSRGEALDVTLGRMADGGAAVPWWTGRTLRLAPPRPGRERASQVILRERTHVAEAPSTETIADLIQAHTLHGGNGLLVTDVDQSAPSPWGRWEGFASDDRVTIEGSARARNQRELADAARLRGQYTRDLTPAVPYRLGVDVLPGDWVTAPTHVKGERVRVAGLLWRAQGEDVTRSVILNDRLLDAELRRRRRARMGEGVGSSGAGSDVRPAPPGQDKRTPAQVTGLVVGTQAYIDPDGAARGLIFASWAAVTKARPEDGGGDMEIDRYELAWRVNVLGAPYVIAASTSETEVEAGPFDVGTTIQVRVRARGKYATAPGVWSEPYTLTVAADTTPPPVPSDLVPSSALGTARWDWDGRTHLDTPMPIDFAYADVEWEGVRDGATVTGTNVLGGAGFTIAPGLDRGSTARARIRAVDRSGNESDWTGWTSVTIKSVLDDTGLDAMLGQVGDRIDHLNNNVIPDLVDLIQLGGGAFTGSTRPPTVEDGENLPVPAIWTQYDGNRIVASWLWDGTAWTPREPQMVHIDSGTFGEFDGLRLRAGTVLADRLAIGTGGELVVDPAFAREEMRTERTGSTTVWVTWGERDNPGAAAALRINTGQLTGNSAARLTPGVTDRARAITVTPNTKYRLRVWHRGEVGSTMRWVGVVYRPDGSRYVTAMPWQTTVSATGWVEHEWTTPADAVAAAIEMQVQPHATPTAVLQFEMPSMQSMVRGVLIENGAVTGDKMFFDQAAVNKLAAGFAQFDTVEVGWLKGAYLEADALDFKTATGMQITSGMFQTEPQVNRGVRIDSTDGLRAWDSSGALRFRASVTGDVEVINGTITGSLIRTSSGATRVQMQDDLRVIKDGIIRLTFGMNSDAPWILSRDTERIRAAFGGDDGQLVFYDPSGGQGLRLRSFTSETHPLGLLQGPVFGGGNSSIQVGITDVGQGSKHAVTVRTHGTGGAFAQVDGQGGWWLGSSTRGRINMDNVSGEILIYPRAGLLSLYNLPTTTLTGQPITMIVGQTGMPSIYRNTSLAKDKVATRDITESLDPALILDVPVRDWLDRGQVERYRAGTVATQADDTAKATAMTIPPRRVPGVIAEEVEAAGLAEFCSYDEAGNLVSVQYDRLALLLIPLVRDLRERITTLEETP
ncbi:hypothetical protein [Ornithinimicrobium sufpigmenti]|uniref:hypothetical protein n=1 Tax=Ornithinimicrobium sufpigmenti TaxID=2508882 RepID=UPI001036CEC3|nr:MULTISPECIES: hypothetical protein [unclassified Ornithinimicrobium]